MVQERFSSRISVIARPSDCDTATLRGAAQYGLAGRSLVSSVIAPQSYMMKVSGKTTTPLREIRSSGVLDMCHPSFIVRSNCLPSQKTISDDPRISVRTMLASRYVRTGMGFLNIETRFVRRRFGFPLTSVYFPMPV